MIDAAMTKTGMQRLIFTDLDGTLLDHDNYSYQPAANLLEKLTKIGIPVIPTTSKTRREVQPLRRAIDNQHPFITENGAGIYIPKDYFSFICDSWIDEGDFWLQSTCKPRSIWLSLIDELSEQFTAEYQTFNLLFTRDGASAIADITGLTLHQASLANEREFSETVVWLSTESRKSVFIKALTDRGAQVHQGGRFLSVTDHVNKGAALLALKNLYLREPYIKSCDTLALGDGKNDVEMLKMADSAIIIRSPHHSPPVVNRTGNIVTSQKNGPEGWAHEVTAWLQKF